MSDPAAPTAGSIAAAPMVLVYHLHEVYFPSSRAHTENCRVCPAVMAAMVVTGAEIDSVRAEYVLPGVRTNDRLPPGTAPDPADKVRTGNPTMGLPATGVTASVTTGMM